MINRSRLLNLISGINAKDPKLFEVLRELIITQEAQQNLLETQDRLTELETEVLPPNVTGFTYVLTRLNVILNWNAVANFYEIRQGTDWNTANRILTTATTQAVFNPLLVGTTSYLIKSISISGVYSANAARVDVIIPPIGTPTPSAQVIDNNVLLRWNEPITTFDILHYKVDRNGTDIGVIRGTFIALFEIAGGTFTYGIKAVDIAGNESARGTIIATVTSPADYELSGTLTDDFTGGTKDNCVKDGSWLIAPVDDAETWTTHYTDQSFDQIQDFINAAYSVWVEPSESTGSYEKIFDFGAIFTDTLVSVLFNSLAIDGTVAVVVKIAVSDDNITYSSFVTATSIFAASVRYVKVRFEFTATGSSIIAITSLIVNLNIKREVDSGTVNADDADTNGTFVAFNKAFRDVDSITLTVDSNNEIVAVYDFNDVPDPTGFYVFAYDSTGARIDALVSWKARGVV